MKNFCILLLSLFIVTVQFASAADLIYGYRNGHYTPVSTGSRSYSYGYRNGIYTPISVKQSGHYRQNNNTPHYPPNRNNIIYGYRNGHYVPIKTD